MHFFWILGCDFLVQGRMPVEGDRKIRKRYWGGGELCVNDGSLWEVSGIFFSSQLGELIKSFIWFFFRLFLFPFLLLCLESNVARCKTW